MKSCTNRFITIIILCIGFLLVSGIYSASSGYALEGTEGQASVTEESLIDLGGPDLIERSTTQGNFSLQSYGILGPEDVGMQLNYTSSNEDVAFVESGGYIDINSAGEAIITVTGNGVKEKKVVVRLNKGKLEKLLVRYCSDYDVDPKKTSSAFIPEDNGYFNMGNHYDTTFYLTVMDNNLNVNYEILDPEFMSMDDNGVISFSGLGSGRIRIDLEESDLYLPGSYYIKMTTGRYTRTMRNEYSDVNAKMSQGGFQLEVSCKPEAKLKYTSPGSAGNIVSVDDNGYVTFLRAGTATVYITAPEDESYYAKAVTTKFTITEDRPTQEITGTVPSETEYGKDIELALSASTEMSYKVNDKSVADVDANGLVHFFRPGTVKITVTAEPTSEYQGASRVITITARDSAAETAAAAAQQAAADKARAAEAAKARAAADQAQANELAKSLKKPKIKVKRQKKKNKISWKKVKGASGYVLYVKYPGTGEYVPAVTKGSNIKSVTHKGLTRKKTYKYRLRAYVKVGNAISYGPYSKVASGKVK